MADREGVDVSDDAWRLSEVLPQPTGTAKDRPKITDRNIFATCPGCGVRRDMLSCDVRFQTNRATYRCPTDGTVLVRVVERGRDKFAEAKVDFEIEIGPGTGAE